jgi:hypothetical protein
MFCTGKTFSEALSDMKPMVKNPGAYQDVVEQKRVVFPVLMETSSIIRSFLIKYPEQIHNMNSLMKKIDRISFDLAKEDPDQIEQMNEKLKRMLEIK